MENNGNSKSGRKVLATFNTILPDFMLDKERIESAQRKINLVSTFYYDHDFDIDAINYFSHVYNIPELPLSIEIDIPLKNSHPSARTSVDTLDIIDYESFRGICVINLAKFKEFFEKHSHTSTGYLEKYSLFIQDLIDNLIDSANLFDYTFIKKCAYIKEKCPANPHGRYPAPTYIKDGLINISKVSQETCEPQGFDFYISTDLNKVHEVILFTYDDGTPGLLPNIYRNGANDRLSILADIKRIYGVDSSRLDLISQYIANEA